MKSYNKNIPILYFVQNTAYLGFTLYLLTALYYHPRKKQNVIHFTPDSATIIFQALIVSKFDYSHSVLYGLPFYLIQNLQHVVNSAARLITQPSRFCFITPVLSDFHWLPVHLLIEFLKEFS